MGSLTSRSAWLCAVVFPIAIIRPTRAQELQFYEGSEPDQRFGVAVAGVGDIDLDGVPDLVVGSDQGYPEHYSVVRAYSGRSGKLLHEWYGTFEGDSFGRAVTGVGDLNGDQAADVLIGAPREFLNTQGYAQVVSGLDGSTLFQVVDPNSEHPSTFGMSVASVGDLNADGIGDFAIGDPVDLRVHLFSGADASRLRTLKVVGSKDFGFAICGLGDINADGVADVAVGAPLDDRGKVYTFSGLDGSLIYIVYGGTLGSRTFGLSLDSGVDVDLDGVYDLLVGADDSFGEAFVFSGRNGKLLFSVRDPLRLKSLGPMVAWLGDVNGDRFPDVLLGCPAAREPLAQSGASRVVSGRDGRILHEFRKTLPGARIGSAVARAGDCDGDGRTDILVGGSGYDRRGDSRGAAWLMTTGDFRQSSEDRQRFSYDDLDRPTFVVDASGSGDFTQIQPAIDRAKDGDLIAVRPGYYEPFVIDRRVLVFGCPEPFLVGGSVIVSGVGPGTGACGIANMLHHTDPNGWFYCDAVLWLGDCSGEITLQSITWGTETFCLADYPLLQIRRCANVSLDDLVLSDNVISEDEANDPRGSAYVIDSSVRATRCFLRGRAGDFMNDPGPGSPALEALRSFVVLDSSTLEGGRGADGYSDCTGHYTYGGDGGPGLLVRSSSAIVMGTGEDLVRGGDGGYPGCCFGYCPYPGGDGGDGIDAPSGTVIVSKVGVEGGSGEKGGMNGDPWDPADPVERDDKIPVLEVLDDYVPGKLVRAKVRVAEPSDVLLIFTDKSTFDVQENVLGPPLAVMPGTWFTIYALGSSGSSRCVNLEALIPEHEELVGLALHAQAVVSTSSGSLYLTNAFTRIVQQRH